MARSGARSGDDIVERFHGRIPAWLKSIGCLSQIFYADQDEGRDEDRFRHDQDYRLPSHVEEALQRRLHTHSRDAEQQRPARYVARDRDEAARQQPEGVQGREREEAHDEAGNQWWPPRTLRIAARYVPERQGEDQDDGRQHSHADQLDERRHIAGLFRHRESGADDLRDIVNRSPEEYASGAVIERQRVGDDRIEDHGDRAQHGYADDGEDQIAFGKLVLRQNGSDRHGRRRAANRHRTTSDKRESPAATEQASAQ